MLVANPADPAIQAAALRCTGITTNQANWVLNTQLQGQTVAIPVFVNKVGPFVTQQVCLPSPDIPTSAGGATFGAQLVSADFTVEGRLHERGREGRLRVGRHLHAVHAGHRHPECRWAPSSGGPSSGFRPR